MRKIVLGIAIAVALLLMAFAFGMCASLFKRGPILGGEIGLVRIGGTIITSDKALRELEEARKDSGIKGLLLRIDSPGGAVSASQEIYEEVKRVNAVKPVFVSMGDVAASGGYYIACGAKKIFANPGTITGSIGVRMEHVNLKDLLTWAKVGHETLKSGEMKDVGAFDRSLTEKEREFLEGILGEMHAQFKAVVSGARGIPADKIDAIADGRIYTGAKALELGLVDEIGGEPVALEELAGSLGIKGEPDVKEFGDDRPWWMKAMAEEVALAVKQAVNSVLSEYRGSGNVRTYY